jgi:uncharacterized integral membrane protein
MHLQLPLKFLHLAMVGVGLYVSIDGASKLYPEGVSENVFREVTVNKTRLNASAFAVTVFAFLQLVMLYNYHNLKGDEMSFRFAYFVLSVINIILGSIILAESTELLKIDGMKDTTPGSDPIDNPDNVLILGIVFGGMAILFNIVNLYHISSHNMNHHSGKRSPRRK